MTSLNEYRRRVSSEFGTKGFWDALTFSALYQASHLALSGMNTLTWSGPATRSSKMPPRRGPRANGGAGSTPLSRDRTRQVGERVGRVENLFGLRASVQLGARLHGRPQVD